MKTAVYRTVIIIPFLIAFCFAAEVLLNIMIDTQ